MKAKLSPYDISYIMKKFRPKTPFDFKEFGLTLRQCGYGCSRVVYTIVGHGLVVKIPKVGEKFSAKRHSVQEYKAYLRIANKKVTKYKKLWPHLPEIYCCNQDGLILMKKYKVCSGGFGNKEYQKVHNIANYLFPESGDTDLYGENLGRDEKGKLVMLDFGTFFKW